MVLRLDDFAVFRANWENKADNIQDIAETLGIGLDALVFVEDNPVERDLVRCHLPMVEVVEMPEDPALYVAALAGRPEEHTSELQSLLRNSYAVFYLIIKTYVTHTYYHTTNT